MTDFVCQEWRTYTPESASILAGRDLGDVAARRLAAELTMAGRLKVLELRDGLQIETTSYVGTVRLGNLELTIQPKLQGLPLVNLLRYAYGLRNLKLFETLPQGVAGVAFHDLLIYQLAAEVSELLARGLSRRYEREETLLASPRGRIDFTALAQQMGVAMAALPCAHHPRQEDTLHNRAILAGLRLGTRLTSDLALRGQLRRLAARLTDNVTTTALNADLLRQVQRHDDRLTAAYRPALMIIELLLAGQGITLCAEEETATVPGFLFDMNRFFQALISRFLHEHLPGYTVRDEHRLRGMLAYDAQRNPQRRRAPAPRPDFVILQGARIAAMLDAKYRDLWETPLPSEMLYQLVIYATSSEAGGRAAILYPTLNLAAQEACIEVRDPLVGSRHAEVLLRPVDMLRLERLVAGSPDVQQTRKAEAYARQLTLERHRIGWDRRDISSSISTLFG
jgi:5-methylcytosine-specific restriction enzyme subunit McrC